MRVMLTSCGLETEQIKEHFLRMLGKEPADTKALFIPTAAIDADAIEVLPKCMNDLLKCGIPKENIRVFDLHQNMPVDELETYDVVYLTGGRNFLSAGKDQRHRIPGYTADLYPGQRFCDRSECGKHYLCQQSAGEPGTAGHEAGCSL